MLSWCLIFSFSMVFLFVFHFISASQILCRIFSPSNFFQFNFHMLSFLPFFVFFGHVIFLCPACNTFSSPSTHPSHSVIRCVYVFSPVALFSREPILLNGVMIPLVCIFFKRKVPVRKLFETSTNFFCIRSVTCFSFFSTFSSQLKLKLSDLCIFSPHPTK